MKSGGISMNVDKMNGVQSTAITYTPTKYIKSDKEEAENKKDTLTLTEEAQQFLAKEKSEKKVKQQNTGYQMDIMRILREQSGKEKSKVVNMSKCFKIAARIGNGDKVPLKDMKYLRENAPELYKNALLFKKHNPEPKKYKSCLDKEDEKSLGARDNALVEASVGADDAIVLNLNA